MAIGYIEVLRGTNSYSYVHLTSIGPMADVGVEGLLFSD